ncbi:MAG TPA: hypothetical protein VJM12_02335 [Pyrinomonadaceae bacterium]|nr:hypothetical protein [Pyrinomonadaceae bacterium]
MKVRNVFCVIMLAAAAALMAAQVRGQKSQLLVADVPFDFTVCQKQLPAGKYRVQPITSASANVLLVRSDDGSVAEIICTHDIASPKPVSQGKLVFNRYGDQYFLAEMWFPGASTGNQLVKSEAEEVLAREVAPRKREKVTIKITEAKPNN